MVTMAIDLPPIKHQFYFDHKTEMMTRIVHLMKTKIMKNHKYLSTYL